MNNIEHLANIYLNLYIKRTNIFYRSLKMQYNSLIAHSLYYTKLFINSYLFFMHLIFTMYYFKNNLHSKNYLRL